MNAVEEKNNKKSSDDELIVNSIQNLKNFKFKRTLSDNKNCKRIALEGRFESETEPAVIVLEKESFLSESISKIFQEENEIKINFINDIYYGYQYFPKSIFNGLSFCYIFVLKLSKF